MQKFDLAMSGGETINIAWKSYAKDKAVEYASGTYTNLNDYLDDEVQSTLPQFLLDDATIDGDLIWYHNYVNADDPDSNKTLEHATRNSFDKDYAIVPFSAPVVSNGAQDDIAGWGLGNTHTLYLKPEQPDNTYAYYDKLNADSITNPYIGFTFNLSDYDPMITSIKS